MGNHFHLLLETPQALLSRGMHWLQTTYTSRFNRRHRLSGHVLQGRFKATIIDGEERGYLATVADYIHLNPVRAGLIDLRGQQLSDYPWSSLWQYLVAARKRAPWLVVERVLGDHGYNDRLTHRRAYVRDLTGRALGENFGEDGQWEQVRRGWYLGSSAFRDRVLEKLESAAGKQAVTAGATEVGADHAQWQAERIARVGMEQLCLTQEHLGKLPKSDGGKVLIASLIKAHTAVSLRWISNRLSMGAQSHVSRLCGRALNKSQQLLKL